MKRLGEFGCPIDTVRFDLDTTSLDDHAEDS